MFSDNFCSNEHRVPRGERGESNILSLINRDTVVFRPRLAKRNRQIFPIAFSNKLVYIYKFKKKINKTF